jgi:CRP-like cAMP-binding protein
MMRGMNPDLQGVDRLNTLRVSELCRAANDNVLEEILRSSRWGTYGPGAVIYREGEPADSFCIIHTGVVEIVNESDDGSKTVVAYLGPTECVGELALLIGGRRTATARVPERAEVLHIPKDVFETLFLRFPVFLRQMCSILAQRLENTTNLKSARTPAASGLEGNLRVFDLAAVLQTLIQAHKTGRLTLDVNVNGEPVPAEVALAGGRMVWARFGRIEGVEAVYQLFQIPLEGRFRFEGAEPGSPTERNINDEPMGVLLEALRLQDELAELRKRLPDPRVVLRPTREALQWADYQTSRYAVPVWQALRKRPESLERLLRGARFSHERIYHVARGLLESGQVEIVPASSRA